MTKHPKKNDKSSGGSPGLMTFVLIVAAIAILVAIIAWPKSGTTPESADETSVTARTEPAENEPAQSPPRDRPPASDEPAGELDPEGVFSTSRFSPDSQARYDGSVPSGPPTLTFQKLVHDFGTMSDTDTRECEFEFTNTGDRGLRITKLTAACTCTETKLEGDKWTYAPGESGKIKTTFKPTRGGQRREVIAVVSNSEPESIIRLYVTAVVTEFLTIEPTTVRFGIVMRGQERKTRFSVGCDNRDLIIEEVVSNNPHVKATLMEANPATGRVPVEVTLDSGAPWGPIRDTRLQFTARGTLEDGREVEKQAGVLVLGTVIDEFRASPTVLSMGPLLPGQAFRKEVTINRSDLQPFEMVEVTLQDPQMADIFLTVVPEPGGQADRYRIIVAGTAGSEDGFVQGVVRFVARGSDGTAEPRDIAITGKIDSQLPDRPPR
ncbi:MAG: DUF1573 domain-containing protein [Phycisphaerales bacterium]|nr:MAG: DUF1573 domain-containing protein [Phycisphaerales bacterium]